MEAMQGTVQAGGRETAEPATTGLKGCQQSPLVKESQKSEQSDLLGLTTKANSEDPDVAKIMRTKHLAERYFLSLFVTD